MQRPLDLPRSLTPAYASRGTRASREKRLFSFIFFNVQAVGVFA